MPAGISIKTTYAPGEKLLAADHNADNQSLKDKLSGGVNKADLEQRQIAVCLSAAKYGGGGNPWECGFSDDNFLRLPNPFPSAAAAAVLLGLSVEIFHPIPLPYAVNFQLEKATRGTSFAVPTILLAWVGVDSGGANAGSVLRSVVVNLVGLPNIADDEEVRVRYQYVSGTVMRVHVGLTLKSDIMS